MHMIDLPLVPADASLREAFSVMRQRRLPAVAVASSGRHALLRAEMITDAINGAINRRENPGFIKVATLRLEVPAALPPQMRALVADLAPTRSIPGAASKVLETHVRADAPFLVGLSGSLARVLTRSSGLAMSLGSAVTFCECTGPLPDVHTFLKGKVSKPGVCNYWSAQHQATLNCDDGTQG